MTKLNRFAESTSDAEGAALVQDITDVLKAMIVEVNEHKLQTALDILAAFVRQTVHGMGDSQFQHVIYYVLAVRIAFFYIDISRNEHANKQSNSNYVLCLLTRLHCSCHFTWYGHDSRGASCSSSCLQSSSA